MNSNDGNTSTHRNLGSEERHQLQNLGTGTMLS